MTIVIIMQNLTLLDQYQYLKKLFYMYHIHQEEEDSIGVALIAGSVLLGERSFVLDLAIILLPRMKILVSPLARLDLISSTSCLCLILSDMIISAET